MLSPKIKKEAKTSSTVKSTPTKVSYCQPISSFPSLTFESHQNLSFFQKMTKALSSPKETENRGKQIASPSSEVMSINSFFFFFSLRILRNLSFILPYCLYYKLVPPFRKLIVMTCLCSEDREREH